MNSVVPAKRFYKVVSVDPIDGGWQVALDRRALKTPARSPLTIASRALADAIAEEWDSQVDKIRPETMPIFRLVATAIDRVGPRRDQVIAASLKFADTDLLCYRADRQSDLAALQETRWQPLLDWARDEYGVELRVTAGLIPVSQPAAALSTLCGVVAGLDALSLTGVSALAGTMGSLVLALALARGRIDAEEAGALALLDEIFQSERWGEDEEARANRARTLADIADTARFLKLID